MDETRKISINVPVEVFEWLDKQTDTKTAIILRGIQVLRNIDSNYLSIEASRLGLEPGQLADIAIRCFCDLSFNDRMAAIGRDYSTRASKDA